MTKLPTKAWRQACAVTAAITVAFLSACRPSAPDGIGPLPDVPSPVPARFPDGWRVAAGGAAQFAEREMVVSNGPLASKVGLEILEAGGNAVDAAVATGFALAVVHPSAGNLGGGGFVVIRMADGRTATLDYRERAPAAATREMYVDPATGNVTDKSRIGHLASGVPGAVAGLLASLERHGTRHRRDVLAPAIRLAREGFVVDSALARSLRSDSARLCRFAGCTTFFPNGRALRPGDTLRQPELARTLERIAADGRNGFYRGPVARAIAAEMERGGGLITAKDLDEYRPVWRAPVTGRYRGHTLISMPPSSSGGVTLIETLNILDAFGAPAPFGSVQATHRLLGALQLAFIDRNEYIADPAFVPVPIARLTDRGYAAAQRARLSDTRYIPTSELAPGLAIAPEPEHTTHYSVVDRHGNAVATTTTINSSHGSAVWIPDGGFLMNNEMDDFTAKPGVANQFGLVQGEANAIAPRKRMLSAMAPTVVLDPHGRVLLVIGSAGGPRIITGVAQIIRNVVDYRMSLFDAMAAPRVHFQALPETVAIERTGFSDAVADSLTAMGWRLDARGTVSSSPVAIKRVATGWEGLYDPRTNGGVSGR